jgi:ubiquinone/menaquinone biosynthesis C-methylase UbiE
MLLASRRGMTIQFLERETMKTYYQEIAPDYARYRRVHPEVLRGLIANGPIHADTRVLEIGCGTGNYIGALRESVGCPCWGVDPTEEMLAQALVRSPSVQLTHGQGEHLSFPDDSFDLTFSVDVVHHLADRRKAWHEAARVLRPNGRLCIVTDSEDIIRKRQPQSIYFPETIEVELSRYPAIDLLQTELLGAGFAQIAQTVVEFRTVLPDLEPYRARVFSSLRLISEEAFARGLARLEKDFRNGAIPWVSRYLMLCATKLPAISSNSSH